jgi:hypothetical protein
VHLAETERAPGKIAREPRLWHEPVGKLERTFDFRDHGLGPAAKRDLRIASATNLVDTLTARLTLARKGFAAKRIESYVETGTAGRIGYQVGTLLAPLAAIPWVRSLARQQIDFLALEPSPEELREERQIVLLEIEDPFRTPVIDWRWETPNPYQFTAQVVVAVARTTARRRTPGWRTPGEVLGVRKDQLAGGLEDFLRDCHLDARTAPGAP